MKLVNKSRKGFITLTLLTIVSITLVLVAYAAVQIGTYTSTGAVTVLGSTVGTVTYSNTNETSATWDVELTPSGSWYSRLEITTNTYTGPVTISWQLQKNNGSWEPVAGATQSTSTSLTAGIQTIYASSNGEITTNKDWSLSATDAGSYRVVAIVASVP